MTRSSSGRRRPTSSIAPARSPRYGNGPRRSRRDSPTPGGSRAPRLGWTSLLVSEADGGGSVSGHGLLDLTLVAEEMGRRVSPGPLLPTNVVAAALSDYGTRRADGRAICRRSSPARPSPPGAWRRWAASGLPQAITLEASPEGEGFVLSGRKGAAQAAAESDFFVVAALVGGEPTQFLVDADAPGVTVVPAEALDLTHRFAFVEFDRVVGGARCRAGLGGRRGGPDRAAVRVGGDAAVRLHGGGDRPHPRP